MEKGLACSQSAFMSAISSSTPGLAFLSLVPGNFGGCSGHPRDVSVPRMAHIW